MKHFGEHDKFGPNRKCKFVHEEVEQKIKVT